MTTEKWIIVKQARFVPIILCIAALAGGIVASPWWFLSIPFALIGSIFTAPNLNLINGLPSYVAIVTGLILTTFHQPAGLAVLVGAIGGFYGSALEMRIFSRPLRTEK